MSEMITKLSIYFSFPFVRNAMIVGVLIALSAAIFGVVLVLKRFSFIGDGLSHVAFGAMAVATVAGATNSLIIVLPVTVASAVLILKSGENRRIGGDATIAMISVSALSLGYLLMNIFSASPNVTGDVCGALFGSTAILTLSALDVWICIALSAVVLAVFIIFYNKIFSVTFDESFAAASGTRPEAWNFVVAILVAVIIVLAMNLVGSLLISALVIFPAVTAMRMFRSFRAVMISAAAVAVITSALGIIIAILASTPVGATIVAVEIVTFLVVSALASVLRR